MAGTIDKAFLEGFATEWIAAWNSGDLERIFSLYEDDFEMRSPLIVPQAEVAATVGLYDQSLLHRHFKRILGVTPGAFARAVW